jgi:hypothetical protein
MTAMVSAKSNGEKQLKSLGIQAQIVYRYVPSANATQPEINGSAD